MKYDKKLNISGSIPVIGGYNHALRLRTDLQNWIKAHSNGSYNSVINFLVNVGINQIDPMLKHDSIYETVDRIDKAKKDESK